MSKKRLALATAAGVSVLGLTAAGASTLDLYKTVAQQSDVTSASCAGGQYGSRVEVNLPITDNVVESARVFQQYTQGCAGAEVQVVLYKGTAVAAKSTKVRIVGDGGDTNVPFTTPVNVQAFDSYRVTIGGQINNY